MKTLMEKQEKVSGKITIRDYRAVMGKYLGPQKKQVSALSILLLISIGLQLASPQIIRTFIDTAQAGAAFETTLKIAVLFIGLAIAQQIATVVATYFSESIAWKATNSLRQDLAKHCLGLDMSFHKGRTPGEMIERLDGDVTTLSNFFSQFVIQLVGNLILLGGIVVFMLIENIWVGLGMAGFITISMFIIARFRNIAVPHWEAEREASAGLFGFLEERLGGTEDIRANGARSYVMHHFYRLMQILMKKSVKAALMVNIMIVIVIFTFGVGIALALGMGGYFFRLGTITMGTVYLIFHYMNMLENPIRTITRQLEDLQKASAGIKRINELFATSSQLPDTGKLAGPKTGSALAVQFENVSFGYNDRIDKQGNAEEVAPEEKEMILKELTFDLKPGTTLGLLGRTGSGKTTLTRLLFRLYDPDTGTIRLQNGSAPLGLAEVPLHELRQQIGMVTQDIQLFHASVRDNLTFFDPEIPDEKIIEEIHALGMGSWLESLADGLDTELESGGGGLSAGQAQLLAFTRIFLKNPGLVILDEASSRLDPATEALIERAVERLVQGRTALIIAHRLHTVQRADQIMILDHGEILEFGERETLANDPDSKFYQLLQTGLEEVLV